jgi:sugar lactone lactonase YvrE
MKKGLIILMAVFFYQLLFTETEVVAQDSKDQVSLKKIWESPNLLTTCESVCYDAIDHLLFVSCINGNPTDKDGNGFISRLSVTGEITTLNWISGINAPKGMGIFMRKLYVTDIDRIVEIDIDKAAIIKEYTVKDAKFLNDITIDNEGNVYISDMGTGKIHRLFKGVVETWLEDKNISGPNGLFYEDGEILIGTKQGIFSTQIEDKRTWQIIKNTGGIDGLEADGYGNYLISDWMGKIQMVNPNREPILLNNTTDQMINAADIEYVTETKTLYVPTFSDNRVMAYELIYK